MTTKRNINRDYDSRCRLTESDIANIVQAKVRNPRMPIMEIAERYGVSPSLISKLLQRHLINDERRA